MPGGAHRLRYERIDIVHTLQIGRGQVAHEAYPDATETLGQYGAQTCTSCTGG